jgi:hypothetical protein
MAGGSGQLNAGGAFATSGERRVGVTQWINEQRIPCGDSVTLWSGCIPPRRRGWELRWDLDHQAFSRDATPRTPGSLGEGFTRKVGGSAGMIAILAHCETL